MMKRCYDMLLRLYPRDLQVLFSAEMSEVFRKGEDERRAEGWAAFARFALGELLGLVAGAAAEWSARLAGAVHGERSLDLTKMRPAGVSRQTYGTAVDEVLEARKRVDFNLNRMQEAIAGHQFREARFYSDEDRKAREHLRLVLRKYKLAE